MGNNFTPVCMTERYWKSSQLSVAALSGHVRVWGHEYVIVNKEGKYIGNAVEVNMARVLCEALCEKLSND